ncbi:unnamed protein product [Rotaria magnacalcarata]|uniref:Meckel syndrome type 1 protein n=5 Tax=Rotaria magnacalcarata TaxID=392030 RepID=A0A815HCB2_9BILA|nr:unnamed protein product [Rotaria magnacalcarata]CAF1352209.1 unnamed protein product [Rotaria magnacalcarata]CAF2140739.1 unnamed protein product [Rotaria magnacalcarata]CAF2159896.1 unnamed protein product [Rotaria magnacalcarata]CAF3823869.1 unnamed protein product [Rotaria magnacalcarata]
MMLNINDDEINYGIYRSDDPLSNFKIRVKLERYTSNALIPSQEWLKIQDDLSRLLDNEGRGLEKPKTSSADVARLLDKTRSEEYEQVDISWQQKLFNRVEFETYEKDIGPDSTLVEQRYFNEIRKMKKSRRQPGKIFTYIESDPKCAERNLDFFMTDSPDEQPSQLALAINTFQKPPDRPFQIRPSKEAFISKINLINENPTLDEIQTNHFASLSYQTMYIMADLSDRIDTTADAVARGSRTTNEHVLCQINVYSNGTIVLKPDFNTGKLAYMIESKNFNNDFYQYYIEHASIPVTKDDLSREKRLLTEFYARQQVYLTKMVGKKFDTPPPNVLKLNVFGEIVSGKNFDYDNIYVYYCLDLTDNWYVESSMLLSGYTHAASSTASSKYDDIVYYSYPFEFELWYKPSPHAADHELPRMPKIYFQIASLDSWNRHRTEGYTYIDIPSIPGFYDEHLSCWRPYGNSIFDELRHFYIGGSSELEDISYVAIPKSFQNKNNNKILSRFGFRTVSTGMLNIRLNVVFQSQSLANEYKKNRRSSVVKHHGFNAFMSNINDTINEYEQAKRRAFAVRERVFRENNFETYE